MDLTKVSNVNLKLDEALDRLEIYFKKREEILKNESLSKYEKIEMVNVIREDYANSLDITKLI